MRTNKGAISSVPGRLAIFQAIVLKLGRGFFGKFTGNKGGPFLLERKLGF